jgi:hypothetical protein
MGPRTLAKKTSGGDGFHVASLARAARMMGTETVDPGINVQKRPTGQEDGGKKMRKGHSILPAHIFLPALRMPDVDHALGLGSLTQSGTLRRFFPPPLPRT